MPIPKFMKKTNGERTNSLVVFKILNPLLRLDSCRPIDQRPNTSSTLNDSHTTCKHNTLLSTHHQKKKHRHHGPPRPPASSGFNFTGECNHCTLHDWYQYPQHGDIIFLREPNFSFILLSIFLQAASQRACWLKVSFYMLLLVIFCAAALKQLALTPAIRGYLIRQYPTSPFHLLAWFWTRGVGAIVAMFTAAGRLRVVVSVVILL
jgi:hypothetical protein